MNPEAFANVAHALATVVKVVVPMILVPLVLVGTFFLSLLLLELCLRGGELLTGWRLFVYPLLSLRSLRRNALRTSLTFLSTFVLVLAVTLVWSVLSFIKQATSEQAKDLKVIVTERFQIPSQMPVSYGGELERLATEGLPPEMRAKRDDCMGWAFVGTSIDPNVRTLDTIIFLFALKPATLTTMMDDLDKATLSATQYADLQETIRKMEANPRGIILGQEKLKQINKKVGERIQAYSFNYKDVTFDFEIVGTFPPGRYDPSAAMNAEYLQRSLDEYERKQGKRHPLAERSLNLYWVRLPSTAAFERFEREVTAPGKFSSPMVKVETAASGVSSFLEAYKDMFNVAEYVVAPAFMVIMAQVVAIAISISVRERRTEMAVLKVLGFGPTQVMVMVLGEALVVGALSGALSSTLTYLLVNLRGGIKFPIAFFPVFLIDPAALWWGPTLGGVTALAGSFLPAWSARGVKVSEVFSKIA